MKRAEYEKLSPSARETHDNDTLIGFLIQRVSLAAAREAIVERMKFLKPQSREYVLTFLERHMA